MISGNASKSQTPTKVCLAFLVDRSKEADSIIFTKLQIEIVAVQQ